MSDIKSLLTNNMNPQAKLMTETRGLQSKWDKTGLLEGLNGVDKAHMAILLENQAQQLLNEATATGTSANSEQWAGVALPLVRRVFAEISAKEFVSVQPMNLPSGLIFYLDFKYGTARGSLPGQNTFNGTSMFGGTGVKLGSTDTATNGLYGVGRYGYTSNFTTSSFTYSTGSVNQTDLDFDTTYTSSATGTFAGKKIIVDIGTNTANIDLNAVRSFTFESGSATVGGINPTGIINELTKVYNTGSLASPYYRIQLIYTGSNAGFGAAGQTGKLSYNLQPTDTTRGDFEDKDPLKGVNAGQGIDAGTDINIPEVNLELKSEPIVAKTRKLKAVWTPELAQDLNAYQSLDAEAELTSIMSEYIALEIDLENLDMLIQDASAWDEYWYATNNRALNAGKTGYDNLGFYNTQGQWFQTLGTKMQKVSNKIHQKTLRGGANFIVCSPTVATILESIPGFASTSDGDVSKASYAFGIQKSGNLNNRYTVYKNPYMTENVMLMGYRGSQFLETGAVFAPYVPLIMTPLVYDPDTFTPRKGLLTRYAKKMIRPEFFGRIFVNDLNAL